jgi:hypothetical protein
MVKVVLVFEYPCKPHFDLNIIAGLYLTIDNNAAPDDSEAAFVIP